MRIPSELEQAIENEIKDIKINDLKIEAEKLSNRYLNEERTGKTLLSKEVEALAYSIYFIEMLKSCCFLKKFEKEKITSKSKRYPYRELN